ncbi:MAG: right-handed parallel beta-helix repeat-containing protein [Sulfuricaulis sp.]|nr:right-handed parallel beta-helix repeat-containing protein [Sulfuricaulis sp.]
MMDTNRPAISRVVRCAVLGFILSAHLVHAAVYQVGPDKPYKRPSAVAAIARNGDVVEIDAGTYAGDAAVWRQDNLTLRGIGGYAHLRADRQAAEEKAIWVIKGKNVTVERIEFSGATVSDRNGAGIRMEGSGITIRNCYFHDNENGVLGGRGEVLIESSEFAHNGFGDGQSHNMYISDATRRFTLRYSYSHHARVGHNLKSRARENRIFYNRIMDEKDGDSSYAIDLSNGGLAYVVGNLIQQGPNAENKTILTFAPEGFSHSQNELYVVNNTFVNDNDSGRFIAVAKGEALVRVVNNIFVGPGEQVTRPVEMRTNLVAKDTDLVDRDGFDYRLRPNSLAIGAGSDPGTAHGINLNPVSHYLHPRGHQARPVDGGIDIGAYEYDKAERRKTSP